MRSDQDGRRSDGTGAQPGHRAEVVDADVETGLDHPPPQQITRLTILVRDGEPGDASTICHADRGEFRETGPETRAVDRSFVPFVNRPSPATLERGFASP